MPDTVHLKVLRQASPQAAPRWEEFQIPWKPNMNVVAALMEIQKNPVNARGEATLPVVWDCDCLEEVCGACSMLINGRARQACSALVDRLSQPIFLQPLSKFPVVRDLMVDRSSMFESLKKVKAWIEIDGTHDLGPGPRVPQSVQAWAYELQRCMTCGVCLEACPQVNPRSAFMGPAPLAQVPLFNAHPLGESLRPQRLEGAMGPGGIAECGKAQNCERACPKSLPLTRVLADLSRETSREVIRQWLLR